MYQLGGEMEPVSVLWHVYQNTSCIRKMLLLFHKNEQTQQDKKQDGQTGLQNLFTATVIGYTRLS